MQEGGEYSVFKQCAELESRVDQDQQWSISPGRNTAEVRVPARHVERDECKQPAPVCSARQLLSLCWARHFFLSIHLFLFY
ncbi:hypothetical protein E2C01_060165 [Portunus trituberculatus]|uniref:Uncharacterized protein n=1 Tax=Portunus trituberculatus TaxID=210409 RepID=A0A5B7H4J0_PORTR|nr:hypothetical protein [Portunus trituberculatus]